MSDHGSGPAAQADPSSDICDVYAFPSPERAGHLVLVMDLFPFAGLSAVFSDAVMCRFRLRPVTIAATGPTAGFDISDSEFTFDCTFEVPVQRDGSAAQEGGMHVRGQAKEMNRDPHAATGSAARAFSCRRRCGRCR